MSLRIESIKNYAGNILLSKKSTNISTQTISSDNSNESKPSYIPTFMALAQLPYIGEDVITKIKSTSWLMNDSFVADMSAIFFNDIKADMKTQQEADIKNALLDELNKLYYSLSEEQAQDLTFNFRLMLSRINTKEGLEIARKFIQNPQLLQQKPDYFNNFLASVNKKDNTVKRQQTQAYIDKILSNPELFDTKYFKESLNQFFYPKTDSQAGFEIKMKALDNPNLFNSRNFTEEFAYCNNGICFSDFQMEKGAQIIDIVAKKPELFDNDEFMFDLGALCFGRNQNWLILNDYLEKKYRQNKFLIENGFYK